MSRKSFLKGAAVLALAGVAVRLIGALYRIPLTNILGAEGIGLYQMAYPVYGLLLTLSTAGIPGAISKLVSERIVHYDRRGARRVFHISLALLSAVGLVSSMAMAFGSGWIARLIAGPSGPMAQPSMLAAAPALLFVSVITAYRGYFQGLQDMTPTALSQVWEQVIKIIPGFYIAFQLNKFGVEYGAAGAMWGVALSELVALVYLMLAYGRKKRRQASLFNEETPVGAENYVPEPFGLVARRLTGLALPMMAGAVFLPLASLADAFIVMNRLHALGYDKSAIEALYGILSGMVNVLVNVPSVLSLSLSTSLIPAIAEANERRDLKSVERRSRIGMRMTMLVSIPSAVGLAVLAGPVLDLLYGSSLTGAQLAIGSSLLLSSSVSVIFLAVVQSTNGTLQGLGRVYVPMISLAIGAAIKIALNYYLVGIPEINIHGAPLGTIVCYLVPTIINLVYVEKATGMKLNAAGMLIRPGLASAFMGGGAWAMQKYLSALTGGRWATVIAVLAAIPIYCIFAVLFGAIGREELSFMPKGERVSSFLGKHSLLKE
jgi:stage V sporulation protein B